MGKEGWKSCKYRAVHHRRRGEVDTLLNGFNLTLTNRFEVLNDLEPTDSYCEIDNEECFYIDKSCDFKIDNHVSVKNKSEGFKSSLESAEREGNVLNYQDCDFKQDVINKSNIVKNGDFKNIVDNRCDTLGNKNCDFTNTVRKKCDTVSNKNCDFINIVDNKNGTVHNKHLNFIPDRSGHVNNSKKCFNSNLKTVKNKSTLTCFYSNADSLLNKRTELEVEMEINKPDIVAICEVKPKTCRYSVQPGDNYARL